MQVFRKAGVRAATEPVMQLPSLAEPVGHTEPERSDCAKRITAPVREDLTAVDALIAEKLHSRIPFINQLVRHIVTSGGKRLRPLLILLLARALGYRGKDHLLLAVIIELIHTATLLHDDVVDNSNLRRGQKTVKYLWGNDASVLVGDFLYSRTFQMINETGSATIARVLADTTNLIAEGEVQQLSNRRQPDLGETGYMDVIRRKTASLFEASAWCSALIAGADTKTIETTRRFGMNVGIGFQLIDDILDYERENDTGKDTGIDLAEGKPTLPFIQALKNGTESDRKLLRRALTEPECNQNGKITALVHTLGGIRYTYDKAKYYCAEADRTLNTLPDSKYLSALRLMTHFVTARNR